MVETNVAAQDCQTKPGKPAVFGGRFAVVCNDTSLFPAALVTHVPAALVHKSTAISSSFKNLTVNI